MLRAYAAAVAAGHRACVSDHAARKRRFLITAELSLFSVLLLSLYAVHQPGSSMGLQSCQNETRLMIA